MTVAMPLSGGGNENDNARTLKGPAEEGLKALEEVLRLPLVAQRVGDDRGDSKVGLGRVDHPVRQDLHRLVAAELAANRRAGF
jgi:hypothetical protein